MYAAPTRFSSKWSLSTFLIIKLVRLSTEKNVNMWLSWGTRPNEVTACKKQDQVEEQNAEYSSLREITISSSRTTFNENLAQVVPL
jgi:hypothetical protein